ncbi:hypothetical protein CVH10_13580 [Halomonas sp. ND22Bw]|nr:hypothetical protein CVH10_13580 [Halomonas sp. ND22Bw]
MVGGMLSSLGAAPRYMLASDISPTLQGGASEDVEHYLTGLLERGLDNARELYEHALSLGDDAWSEAGGFLVCANWRR